MGGSNTIAARISLSVDQQVRLFTLHNTKLPFASSSLSLLDEISDQHLNYPISIAISHTFRELPGAAILSCEESS